MTYGIPYMRSTYKYAWNIRQDRTYQDHETDIIYIYMLNSYIYVKFIVKIANITAHG